MMDMDGPLDFESEDPLLLAPTLDSSAKRRKKVIGLDDLLTDFYKEQKVLERKSKLGKKEYNSDDDDDKSQEKKEALLSKFVDDCQKQVRGIVAEDEIPLWGQHVFGRQKAPPSLAFPGLGSCKILQSFMRNELNLMLELNDENGESFFEELMIHGWFLKLVSASGHVEDLIASWSFYLMLYSSNEELQASACDFWLAILLSINEVDQPAVHIDWFPSYIELKEALTIYGCLLFSSTNSSRAEVDNNDCGPDGPPQNIRSWIKFVGACCCVRSARPLFSTTEVVELLGVIIHLFLDRRLHGLSVLLHESMQSVISFFPDNEWITISVKVAKSLAYRISKDLNCLKLVECIPGCDTRGRHLRSEVALQTLIDCFDTEVSDAEDILELLLSINIKDKRCDFFKIYIYLNLAENWLSCSSLLEQRPLILEKWGVYLRNCSCQITSTDLRSYASKGRRAWEGCRGYTGRAKFGDTDFQTVCNAPTTDPLY